jgi:hypothetical protein
MNRLPSGYKEGLDGLFYKECEFMNGSRIACRETLVRTKRGELIKVIRGTVAMAAIQQKASTAVVQTATAPC